MRRDSAACAIAACAGVLMLAQTLSASTAQPAGGAPHGLDSSVLIGIAAILIVAKLCGGFFERIGQPAVLGELIGGIIIGNLFLLGFNAAESLKTNEVIAALAEIGVILLLFEVGLESNLKEMLEVGWSSLLVAIAGTTASFLLGWGVAAYFLPGAPRLAHLYIGASLCATSVGITARVLKDMNKLATREARIILGAAVTDDVLGLLILAIMLGAIKTSGNGTQLFISNIAWLAAKAIAFIISAMLLGRYLVPRLFRGVGRFNGRGVLLTVAIAFCFLLAWAASKVDLAPIIGAFAAGLVLDDVHFELLPRHEKRDLQQLLTPVTTVFVPIFFVMVGIRVDLRALVQVKLLAFALAFTLAAMVGKQICSVAAVESGINRVAIGLGMMPRGEVELIFAGMGATLMLTNANGLSEPVVSPATFGVVVMMVIVTTLLTPPALKWSLARHARSLGQSAAVNSARETAEDAAERLSH